LSEEEASTTKEQCCSDSLVRKNRHDLDNENQNRRSHDCQKHMHLAESVVRSSAHQQREPRINASKGDKDHCKPSGDVKGANRIVSVSNRNINGALGWEEKAEHAEQAEKNRSQYAKDRWAEMCS
jgi:hypothetical protein